MSSKYVILEEKSPSIASNLLLDAGDEKSVELFHFSENI